MGVAVVYGTLQKSEGSISGLSGLEREASFEVLRPLQGSVAVSRTEATLPLETGRERILLVDDETVIVDMQEEMLRRLGYEVTARCNSREALKDFLSQPDRFNLVIMDQTMPYMTGAELAKELLKVRPDVPIILCTGFSESIDEERARAIGIRQFLMKPISMHDIAEIIRKILADTKRGEGG